MKKIFAELLFVCTIVIFSLCGCGQNMQAALQETDSFANAFAKTNIMKSLYCYRDLSGHISLLDYDSMKTAPLCKKPNCRHTEDDCIVHRLNGQVPVFGENCAYYFIDEPPAIEQNADGLPDLALRSALYRYDFASNTEEKLMQWDGGAVSDPSCGMLLHNGTLYFMDSQLGRFYDENGILSSYINYGGDIRFHSVSLSDMKTTDLCDLLDIEKLAQYYPYARNSGDVYMKGFYDNKIYFTIGFVDCLSGDNLSESAYFRHYSTYYDLTDGKYYGEPTDYGNIDFSDVLFCSGDYTAICKENTLTVWKHGESEPTEITDSAFYDDAELSVFDDMLFCEGKIFDLKLKTVREADALKSDDPILPAKNVIAKYGNGYILHDETCSFEKIPAGKLLN